MHSASPIHHQHDDSLMSSSLSWSDDDRPVTPTCNLDADKEDIATNKSNIEPKNLLGVNKISCKKKDFHLQIESGLLLLWQWL